MLMATKKRTQNDGRACLRILSAPLSQLPVRITSYPPLDPEMHVVMVRSDEKIQRAKWAHTYEMDPGVGLTNFDDRLVSSYPHQGPHGGLYEKKKYGVSVHDPK